VIMSPRSKYWGDVSPLSHRDRRPCTERPGVQPFLRRRYSGDRWPSSGVKCEVNKPPATENGDDDESIKLVSHCNARVPCPVTLSASVYLIAACEDSVNS